MGLRDRLRSLKVLILEPEKWHESHNARMNELFAKRDTLERSTRPVAEPAPRDDQT
jgi:hypothetical protein